MKVCKIILIIIILFITSTFSGCFNNTTNSDKKINYSLQIILRPSTRGSFYTYLPIPIHNNGSVSNIANSIKIKSGTGHYFFKKTIYGVALNLSSDDYIELELKGNEIEDIEVESDIPQIYLSLDNDLDNDGDKTEWDDSYVQYHSFFNSSLVQYIDILLAFKIKSDPSDFLGEIRIESRIINGWQLINGTMNASLD